MHKHRHGASARMRHRRAIEHANGVGDWMLTKRTYVPALIEHYEHSRLPEQGVSFADMLAAGLVESLVNRHGLFRPFMLYVLAYPNASDAALPHWAQACEKLQFEVHPGDPQFAERLIQQAVEYKVGGEDPQLTARLVVRDPASGAISEDLLSRAKQSDLMGLLINARPFELELHIVPTATSRPPVSSAPFAYALEQTEDIGRSMHGEARGRSSEAPGRRTRGQRRRFPFAHDRPIDLFRSRDTRALADRDLHPIADALAEHIAGYMCSTHVARGFQTGKRKTAKKHTSALIRDELVVSSAVRRAVMTDAIYKQHGAAASAEEFYHKRGLNIGAVINELTRQVMDGNKQIKQVGAMLTKQKEPTAHIASTLSDRAGATAPSSSSSYVLNEKEARSILKNVAIQSCLMDRFKAWIGISNQGYCDDGGPDQGPSLSLAYRYRHRECASSAAPLPCPPVYNASYCPEPLPPAPVVYEEAGEDDDDDDDDDDRDVAVQAPSPVVQQSVIVRNSDDHHHHSHCCTHHHRRHACDFDDEDDLCAPDPSAKAYMSASCSDDDEDDAPDGEDSDSDDDYVASASEKQKHVSAVKYFDVGQHKHFLELFQLAEKDLSVHLRKPYLLLAPSDAVFTRKHLDHILAKIRAEPQKHSCAKFIENYLVVFDHEAQFDEIAREKHTFTLMAVSKVVYKVDMPRRRFVPCAASAGQLSDDALCFTQELLPCQTLHKHARCTTIRVMHTHFPKAKK